MSSGVHGLLTRFTVPNNAFSPVEHALNMIRNHGWLPSLQKSHATIASMGSPGRAGWYFSMQGPEYFLDLVSNS